MPRALARYPKVVLRGVTDAAPTSCECRYRVTLDDLSEPATAYVVPGPNFNQATSALVLAAVTAAKANEAI